MSETVDLIILGKLWREWSSVEVSHSLDGISTFKFVAPWDPNREDMREAFSPYRYQDCEIIFGAKPQLQGHIVTPVPAIDQSGSTVTVTGYCRPGLMQDCTVPETEFPLEFNKVKLDVAARKVSRIFGVDIDVEADLGAKFDRLSLDPTDKPWTKLIEWAKERNLIMRSQPDGDLLITDVKDGPSVADFTFGRPPLTSISGEFNGQNYFSQVTSIATTKLGSKGGRFTVQNPRLRRPTRANIIQAEKSQAGDLPKSANAFFGRMYANAATWKVQLPTWRNAKNELWNVGQYVNVLAHHVFLYKRTKLLVRNVTFFQDSTQEYVDLDLCIKESFGDTIPESLPWDS